MIIPLKEKYLSHKSFKCGKYRPRNGPKCCNKGCVGRKKRLKNRARMKKHA